jgi:hypothetical protein
MKIVAMMFAASVGLLTVGAEDLPEPPRPASTTELEPALPIPEQNPADSSPSLLPESNELPPILPVEHTIDHRTVATKAPPSQDDHFESIRNQAMNNPRAVYLLKRAKRSSTSAARRSYLRAYYVRLAERMRQLDPKLKSSINEYEQTKLGEIGGRPASSRRTARRSQTHKAYVSRHTRSHRHHYQRVMVIEDPYGPDFVPYYGPPVVFYPW